MHVSTKTIEVCGNLFSCFFPLVFTQGKAITSVIGWWMVLANVVGPHPHRWIWIRVYRKVKNRKLFCHLLLLVGVCRFLIQIGVSVMCFLWLGKCHFQVFSMHVLVDRLISWAQLVAILDQNMDFIAVFEVFTLRPNFDISKKIMNMMDINGIALRM